MKYYFLISYLPEIHRDDKKLRLRVSDLLAEKVHFAEKDWAQIELVLLAGDVLQVERLLSGKELGIDYQLFGREFWKEQIKSPKEVPEVFAGILDALLLEGPSPKNLNLLFEAYYAYAAQSASGPFLPAYFRFEKDLRNIMAAIRARRKGLSPSDDLVGDGEIIDSLSRSTAEDFGLGPEYPWIERLIAAKEPVETQEAIEQIMWETLEEMTEPMDFDFDVILAYLLKLQLLERNLALSEEQGMEVVRQLEEL
ncbi:MAG: DUF2764 family protein [Pseudomonadota bacterium]